jgi:hypothetical protein
MIGVTMLQASRAVLISVFVFASGLLTTVRADEDRWADFRFLVGSWVSVGPPEQGSGSFSLEPELDGKVLVRRNVAYVPAGRDRAPAKHEDLMVIYPAQGDKPGQGGKQMRASYFDSEGHIIQYSVNPTLAKRGLVFVSEPNPSAPRFRLTYTKIEGGKVAIEFEIAPPGRPEQFKKYLAGTVTRKPTGKGANEGL